MSDEEERPVDIEEMVDEKLAEQIAGDETVETKTRNDGLIEKITNIIGIAFPEEIASKSGALILGEKKCLGMAVFSPLPPASFEQITETVQILCATVRFLVKDVPEERQGEMVEIINAAFAGGVKADA